MVDSIHGVLLSSKMMNIAIIWNYEQCSCKYTYRNSRFNGELNVNFTFRSHMQDLQEVTHDLHYENYRATRLADGSDSDGPGNASFPLCCALINVVQNITLAYRFGQTTCSCTKIRYRYQVERKGSWIGSYASYAFTNATTAQTTKSSSVLVFITQRLNYNLGVGVPLSLPLY